MPVRKNGHLLLITLILANMIVNETLPLIAEPVLGGGIPAVVASTALIVMCVHSQIQPYTVLADHYFPLSFSEIIPQSICTRYGLAIGATMALPVQILIYALVCYFLPLLVHGFTLVGGQIGYHLMARRETYGADVGGTSRYHVSTCR